MRTFIALTLMLSIFLHPRLTAGFAQGSLTPPGAPAPTMKTLDQIEPRTPIKSLPYTVEEPGSYYLTGPHFSTNTGITISASDVTIDLMGFTIHGSQNANHPGIQAVGGEDVMLRNIVIRNGGVARFGVGLLIENTQSGTVRDITIHQNMAEGVILRNNGTGVCSDITVEDCTITDNGGDGLRLDGSGLGQFSNRSHIIRNNKISGNRDHGIFVDHVYGSIIEGNVIGPQVTSSNSYAIRSGVSRNLYVRNLELGNTNVLGSAFIFVSTSDTRGPTVNASGVLSTTNNEVHPWANFSR
ncbi:MAG TPA: right-handed parallel beta-helix repeat-containing protein [Verrucomicrobiota bacterium]|nr:right-handed parallel beta-helix repeat-containing protein [Verrucomicrobiota bacterium]